MRSLRISRLLPALFVLMVVLGVVQGLVAFRSLSAMTGHIERIGEERMPQMSAILRLSNAFSELNATYYEHLLSMDIDRITAIEATLKERSAALGTMLDAYAAANAGDPQAVSTVEQIKTALATYLKDSEQLLQFSAIAAKGPAQEVYDGPMKTSADAIEAALQGLIAGNEQVTGETIATAQAEHDSAFALTIASLALSVGLATAAIFLVNRRVVKPLNGIAGSMKTLAEGDTNITIPHADRTDEIGEMAAAVAVFRDNAAERLRLERQTEADRAMSENERQAREAERTRDSGKVQAAVQALAGSLERLAAGDVTCRIDTPFEGDLDRIRLDFNESVGRLNDALREVGVNARAIDAGANQIRAAADDLSRRTEQQAASVEETAAALEEIKGLITTSGEQVRTGVSLVGDTGKALETIVVEVQEINSHVQAIVEAAREQSTGLQEINTAVNTMDQGTQQNAAMVEETTAASHGLAAEVSALNALIGRFNVGASSGVAGATHAARRR